MRCSYCDTKGHSKRSCPHIARDFAMFVEASRAIRRDYLALLGQHHIGPGTTFRVSNYGNELVRVSRVHDVNLFSTWQGVRNRWWYRPLEEVAGIVVELYDEETDTTREFKRLFSVKEIHAQHTDLKTTDTPFWDEAAAAAWSACAEFVKHADMIARQRKKGRMSVFGSKDHPYVSRG